MNAIPPSFGKTGILRDLSNVTSKLIKSVWRVSSDVRGEDRYNGLEAAGSNLSASDSRLTDTESARVIIEYTKSKILSRAPMSVAGQANQTKRRIISLIQ